MITSKKISVSVLLCIIALPFVFFVLFLCKQQWVQHEMKEQLETAFLQTITRPTAEVSWVKADKEVLIDGDLFDVKSFSVANGNITLVGLFDEKEKDLSANLTNILRQKSRNQEPLNQLAFKFLLIPYFDNALQVSIKHIGQTVEQSFLPFTVSLTQQYFPIPGPPPKFL